MQSPENPGDKSAPKQRRVRRLRYEAGEVEADATTILKKLFDRVVQECNVHPARWRRLCDAYINRQERERGAPLPNQVEARASINKNFGSLSTMTFKNLFKGFIFMRAKRVTLTVTLEHHSGAITEHGVSWRDNGEITPFDPEIDYDPRTPTEVHDIGDYVSRGSVHEYVAPPDLSQYAGQYPSSIPASSSSFGIEGVDPEREGGIGGIRPGEE